MKKQLTQEEWMALGKEKFGENMLDWKFECPLCHHVASPNDFLKHKEQGANPNCATIECIGRYLPKEQRAGLSSDHSSDKVQQPCDYAGYGLFQLSPLEVTFPDGKKTQCFAFAEVAV